MVVQFKVYCLLFIVIVWVFEFVCSEALRTHKFLTKGAQEGFWLEPLSYWGCLPKASVYTQNKTKKQKQKTNSSNVRSAFLYSVNSSQRIRSSCRISFFVLMTEQCPYSFRIIKKREMIWESILANSTKANYRACIWKSDKGNEREHEELNCGRCFCFFLQPVLGPAFGSKVTTPSYSHPLMSAYLWPIRASDWLVILFYWFCQLYVNVLSLYTAWPGVVCVPCALATCLYHMSEREG